MASVAHKRNPTADVEGMGAELDRLVMGLYRVEVTAMVRAASP